MQHLSLNICYCLAAPSPCTSCAAAAAEVHGCIFDDHFWFFFLVILCFLICRDAVQHGFYPTSTTTTYVVCLCLVLCFLHAEEDRVSDFELKLMDIDSEHLGIPDTDYAATVTLPAAEYQRICRDLSSIGDTGRFKNRCQGFVCGCRCNGWLVKPNNAGCLWA